MKKPTVSKLKKKLDKFFSEYIRKRDGKCITCGIKKPWKELQCGHYVPRIHSTTRFDERNCNAQCLACNCFKHGALDEYALKLQKMYGDGILKELHALKHQVKQFTIKELEELIVVYTQKLK